MPMAAVPVRCRWTRTAWCLRTWRSASHLASTLCCRLSWTTCTPTTSSASVWSLASKQLGCATVLGLVELGGVLLLQLSALGLHTIVCAVVAGWLHTIACVAFQVVLLRCWGRDMPCAGIYRWRWYWRMACHCLSKAGLGLVSGWCTTWQVRMSGLCSHDSIAGVLVLDRLCSPCRVGVWFSRLHATVM